MQSLQLLVHLTESEFPLGLVLFLTGFIAGISCALAYHRFSK